MAQDYLYWKNGINNEFSPTSLTDVSDGSGYVATAVISSVTTESVWKMSQYDAYQDLFERLHQGQVNVLPQHTTTEKNALSNIYDGVGILDITLGREDICYGGVFISAAGSSGTSPSAYGGMYEDNSSGSSISVTASYVGWISATTGVVDGNSIVTFTSNATADRLTIGTSGAGDYEVSFHASVKNSGGKLTTAAIHVNGVEQTSVKMSLTGDSSKAVHLGGSNPLTLAANDYIDLRFKSEASDTVTVYQVNVHIERMS